MTQSIDCIDQLLDIANQHQIMVFTGDICSSKTTLANIICHESYMKYIKLSFADHLNYLVEENCGPRSVHHKIRAHYK
jgi:hypothetical protein